MPEQPGAGYGPDGNEYTTTRWNTEIARIGQDMELAGTKFLGTLLGLASLGVAASDRGIGLKAAVTPALALAAYKMFTRRTKPKEHIITSPEGYEIPATTMFEKATKNFTKTGELFFDTLWPATPEAFGLDYAALGSKIKK